MLFLKTGLHGIDIHSFHKMFVHIPEICSSMILGRTAWEGMMLELPPVAMIDGTQKNKHCSVNLPRKLAHMHTHYILELATDVKSENVFFPALLEHV